jgi:magnesium transporter
MALHGLLAEDYAEQFPEEVARALEGFSPAAVAEVFAGLPAACAAGVLTHMVPVHAAAVVEGLDPETLGGILSHLATARCAVVLQHVASARRAGVIALVPPTRRAQIERLLRAAASSAGLLVEPVEAGLSPRMTAAEALPFVRRTHLSYGYVVDTEHRLIGVVDRRQLEASHSDTRIVDLMSREVSRLPAGTSLAALARHPAWEAFDVLPVVDGTGVLVGIIRHKALRRSLSTRPSAPRSQPRLGTVLELGELYWNGLSTLVYMVSEPSDAPSRKDDTNAR